MPVETVILWCLVGLWAGATTRTSILDRRHQQRLERRLEKLEDLHETQAKTQALRKPAGLVDALQDRIHATSGRLLATKSVETCRNAGAFPETKCQICRMPIRDEGQP